MVLAQREALRGCISAGVSTFLNQFFVDTRIMNEWRMIED
jgi:hypothetical protein